MELIQEFLASPYEAGGLVLDWPSVPPRTCVFVPLLVRDGGVLGAVPFGFLDASLVSAGQTGALDAVVGPSSEVELALAEEEEDGSLRPVEEVCKALLVDFSLEVASFVARYDPVTSPVEAVPFVPARPDQQIHLHRRRRRRRRRRRPARLSPPPVLGLPQRRASALPFTLRPRGPMFPARGRQAWGSRRSARLPRPRGIRMPSWQSKSARWWI